MLFYWLSVVILKFSISTVFGDVEYRRVIRQAGSPCTDPDNRPGSCIGIRSCQPLLDLVTSNRGREPAVVAFLRQSQCAASINGQPQICCSSDGIPPSLQPYDPSPSISTQRILTTSMASQYTQRPTPTNTNTDFSQCGKSDKKVVKILGMSYPFLGDWPWMAALGYRTASNSTIQFRCGGSLISNRWIVTVAHCVQNIGRLSLTTARLGDLVIDNDYNDEATLRDFVIDQIIPHPDFVTRPIQNDIALLKLRDNVTFTRFIRPICIPSDAEHKSDAFYVRKVPFIFGWRSTQWQNSSSLRLLDEQVEIVDNQRCARNYSNETSPVVSIDQRVLCANDGGRRHTCQAPHDNWLGGPWIMSTPIRTKYNETVYYLSGIGSVGGRCGDATNPGVYTRVAYFADWIKNTTGV